MNREVDQFKGARRGTSGPQISILIDPLERSRRVDPGNWKLNWNSHFCAYEDKLLYKILQKSYILVLIGYQQKYGKNQFYKPLEGCFTPPNRFNQPKLP